VSISNEARTTDEKVRDEIVYNLVSGNMIFLETTAEQRKKELLKSVIKQLRKRSRVFYLDCRKKGQDPNIKKVFQNRYWIIGRLFNINPKNMIIFLDNIQHMSNKNCEVIKYYFDHDNIKSVLFVGESYSQVKLSPSIKHRIGKRVFRI